MTSDDWPRRLAVLRFLVAGYAAVWTMVRAPPLLDTTELAARRFDPIGPLWFLEGPVASGVVVAAVIATPVTAALMAAGWRYRLTAPAAAAGFLFLTTYRNSWGQLFHTENLVALHLIVLALAPGAAGAWSLAHRRAAATTDTTRWAVRTLAVLTVGTYLVAGIAKLRISGWDWVDGEVLRHQVAFDNARKDLLGDRSAPLGVFFLRQSWLLGPAAVMTMIVELTAPLALVNRRIAAAWVTAAVGFHIAILAVMAIVFPYHLIGIALAPLLPVERLGTTVAGWTGRFPPPLRSALRAG